MKLGLSAGYWSREVPDGIEDTIKMAEDMGFDSLWTSEAYGSDCLTPLAWWGAKTSKIKLGTAIAQISARTPAATAMAAMTLDHLSAGRFILGIGASGPQVVEGWYGQPYPKPLARTREYVQIIREILAREKPVEFHGNHYDLPLQGGLGLGKALKSTVHPVRKDLPIYLAAEGPKNVALAGEIADGWLPMFISPKVDDFYRGCLAEGFAKSGNPEKAKTFEVAVTVPTIVSDDIEMAADFIRPMIALYVGGMGAKGANFHFNAVARLGYEEECLKIQELYLQGKKNEAIAAVPTALVEDMALIGPVDKIKDELTAWKSTCATTMLIGGPPALIEQVAKILL